MGFALLVALAVSSSALVWGIWRFLIHEETQRAEQLLRPGAVLEYDPDCGNLHDGNGPLLRVSVVGGPVTSEAFHQSTGTLPPSAQGVLYQLTTTLDERRWNADFNQDGDTEDLMSASTDPDAVAGARVGLPVPGGDAGGLRLLPDGPAVLAGFLDADVPGTAVVQAVRRADGSTVSHEQVADSRGLEGAEVLAAPDESCWFVRPLE